jgi:hypothetical protein
MRARRLPRNRFEGASRNGPTDESKFVSRHSRRIAGGVAADRRLGERDAFGASLPGAAGV